MNNKGVITYFNVVLLALVCYGLSIATINDRCDYFEDVDVINDIWRYTSLDNRSSSCMYNMVNKGPYANLPYEDNFSVHVSGVNDNDYYILVTSSKSSDDYVICKVFHYEWVENKIKLIDRRIEIYDKDKFSRIKSGQESITERSKSQ